MARVSMPAVFRNLAVPPVETSSTPSSARPRAKSTTPRLSETVMSARCTRTWPGATISYSGATSTSVIDDHPAWVIGVDPDLSLGGEPRGVRQQLVLDLVHLLLHDGDVARIRKLEGTLEDDGAAVHALVHEVDRDPRDLDPVLQRLLDDVDAREGRQQRRVDVDDGVAKAPDEVRAEQFHEPREDDQPGTTPLDPVPERCVARGPVGVAGDREHGGLDAGCMGPLEPAGVR